MKWQAYWEGRRSCLYYRRVRELLESMPPAGTLVDIGGHSTPVVTWGQFGRRILIDPTLRPDGPRHHGVDHIPAAWPLGPDDWRDLDGQEVEPIVRAEVITCLQVMEHVATDKIRGFARALLGSAETLIVTVPYRWKPGRNKSHVHDPVDQDKMAGWFSRDPDQWELVTEKNGTKRLLTIYRQKTQDPTPRE